MESVYYKEEELHNGDKGVFEEEYSFCWIGDYHIGLCMNAHSLFCRADNCADGHQHLSQTNRASSWLKMLDTICPKIAWGVTAWLFFYSNRDDKGRLRFLGTTRAEVFAKYKEECLARYRYLQRDEYDYLRENGDADGIKALDEAFANTHIQQEREYISRFTHHECMSEEYYNAIALCAKEYVEWVEDSKASKSTPTEKSIITKPANSTYAYTPTRNPNWAKILELLKTENRKGNVVVDENIDTLQFLGYIRNADMESAVVMPTHRCILTYRLRDYFIGTDWYDVVCRSMNMNNTKLSKRHTNSGDFEAKLNKILQEK